MSNIMDKCKSDIKRLEKLINLLWEKWDNYEDWISGNKEDMKIIPPDEDKKKIFLLYLDRFDLMTDKERDVFCDYLSRLSSPMFLVK